MRMAALFFALVGLASAADRSAMRFPGSAVKYVVPVLDLDIRHDGSGPRMPHETRHGGWVEVELLFVNSFLLFAGK